MCPVIRPPWRAISGRCSGTSRSKASPSSTSSRKPVTWRSSCRWSAEPTLQVLLDLSLIRKSTRTALGIDKLVPELDFEDAVGSLDELGLEPELLLDAVRQTDGPRSVVSNHAVFDSNSGHNDCLLGDYTDSIDAVARACSRMLHSVRGPFGLDCRCRGSRR